MSVNFLIKFLRHGNSGSYCIAQIWGLGEGVCKLTYRFNNFAKRNVQNRNDNITDIFHIL